MHGHSRDGGSARVAANVGRDATLPAPTSMTARPALLANPLCFALPSSGPSPPFPGPAKSLLHSPCPALPAAGALRALVLHFTWYRSIRKPNLLPCGNALQPPEPPGGMLQMYLLPAPPTHATTHPPRTHARTCAELHDVEVLLAVHARVVHSAAQLALVNHLARVLDDVVALRTTAQQGGQAGRQAGGRAGSSMVLRCRGRCGGAAQGWT